MTVSFKISDKDFRLVLKIIERANKLYYELKNEALDDPTSYAMDIRAVHANGCPLDLKLFLSFGNFDFWHDFIGITRNIDRETGELLNHFLPRCRK